MSHSTKNNENQMTPMNTSNRSMLPNSSPSNTRLPQSKGSEIFSVNNNKFLNSNQNQKSDLPSKKVGRPPINRNEDNNVFDRNKPAKSFGAVENNKPVNKNQIFDERNLKFNSQKESEFKRKINQTNFNNSNSKHFGDIEGEISKSTKRKDTKETSSKMILDEENIYVN